MLAYFDHAATTSVLPEAVDSMLPWLREEFGNPSGVHRMARNARTGLEEARDRFASVVGAQAREIVFTGGGTESLNLALRGVIDQLRRVETSTPASRAIAWSSIEHDAIRSCVGALVAQHDAQGFELPVDRHGVLDLAAVDELLHDNVRLVSVMAVNNEVGTVQPIVALREIMNRRSPHALLVVDAVQALTWIDVRPIVAVADLVAFSGHKLGAPKGVGALVVREGTSLVSLIQGGGQERERRSGTQNVAGIVALATAAELTNSRRLEMTQRVSALRDQLVDGLVSMVPDSIETVARQFKVGGNAHICIAGIESEELLLLLDQQGLCASAGSACASGALHLSPVLEAMGVARSLSAGALRLTLGPTSTGAEVDHALAVIPASVAKLRS
jgi:cysteine desulfurase